MSTSIRHDQTTEGQLVHLLKSDVEDVVVDPVLSPEGLIVGGANCNNGCCARISIFTMTGTTGVACKVTLDDAVDIAEHILNEVSRLRSGT